MKVPIKWGKLYFRSGENIKHIKTEFNKRLKNRIDLISINRIVINVVVHYKFPFCCSWWVMVLSLMFRWLHLDLKIDEKSLLRRPNARGFTMLE